VTPADSITIRGIEVFAHHGVHAEEKEEGQVFLVDLTVETDLSPAGRSDQLADTIDYGGLAGEVHALVASQSWNLLETVAEQVASLVLTHPRVRAVTVTVHKPEAPLPVKAADVSVEIRRLRS
jgi:dihydroneopterin aldolase